MDACSPPILSYVNLNEKDNHLCLIVSLQADPFLYIVCTLNVDGKVLLITIQLSTLLGKKQMFA